MVRLPREDADDRHHRDYHNGKRPPSRGHAEDPDTDRAIQADNRDRPVRHEPDGSNIVRRLHPRCPRAVCWRGAPRQHTNDDLDRPSRFFAFSKVQNRIYRLIQQSLAGRSSDRFTSIHALPRGENWWRRGSLQQRIRRGMGQACNCQHRPGSRGRHCGAPQTGQHR